MPRSALENPNKFPELKFLATLVALHFTPVSESVSGSYFRTSVASRLASLFLSVCSKNIFDI